MRVNMGLLPGVIVPVFVEFTGRQGRREGGGQGGQNTWAPDNLVPRLFLRGRKDPGRSWSRDVKKFDCLRLSVKLHASTCALYTSVARSECCVQPTL